MRTITITITEEMAHLIFELREIIGKTPYNKEQKEVDSHAHVRSSTQLRSCETKEESEKEEETSPRTPLKEEEREKEERQQQRQQPRARILFSKPTVEEVERELKNYPSVSFCALDFINYYESVGWDLGKKKVRNWQALLYGWIRKEPEFANGTGASSASSTSKPAPKPKAPDNRVLFVEPVLPDTSEDISYVEYLESLKKKGGTG